jgi:hypothetical protein
MSVPLRPRTRLLQSCVVERQSTSIVVKVGMGRVEESENRFSPKRCILRHATEKQTVYLPPVNCVPPEIWGEVFDFCVLSSQAAPHRRSTNRVFPSHRTPPVPYSKIDSREAPLVLTQVCRTWRNIVTSMSRLWTSLDVDAANVRDEALLARIPLMHLWLERSGTHPLTLNIKFPNVNRSPARRYLPDNLFTILLSQSYRWKNVSIEGSAKIISKLLDSPHTFIPRLEFLSLHILDCRWIPGANFSISSTATRLRTLEYTSDWLEPVEYDLAWQLTHLHSDASTLVSEVPYILSQARRLSHLTLSAVDEEDPENLIELDSVSHAELRVFDLTSCQDLAPLFNAITLPQLRSLTIDNRTTLSPWPQLQFIAMLLRSSSPLRQLELFGHKIPEEHLIDIVQTAPELVRFSVHYGGCELVTDRVREVLCRKSVSSERAFEQTCSSTRMEWELQ